MPFSFNPGQEQAGQVTATAPASGNNGVPALNVPVAPVISLTPTVEAISPFAYKNRSKSKFGVYFQLAVFLIFAVALFATIGIFAYQGVLSAQISSKKNALDTMQASFPKMNIDEMQKLSSRTGLINKVVNERASVATALTVIEESVVDNSVVYNKFSLSRSKKDNYYDVGFAGDTTSYVSLYQQIEVFKSKLFSKALPKVTITGIGPLDKKGLASFNVSGSMAIGGIDPDGFTVIGGRNASSTETVSSSTTVAIPAVVNQANASATPVTP
jgi:hypothetical protein